MNLPSNKKRAYAPRRSSLTLTYVSEGFNQNRLDKGLSFDAKNEQNAAVHRFRSTDLVAVAADIEKANWVGERLVLDAVVLVKTSNSEWKDDVESVLE